MSFLVSVPMPSPQAGVKWTALTAAVRQAGEYQKQAWIKAASGEVVDRRSGAYINGLRTRESMVYPYEGDQLAIGVFNRAKHANVIEYGHGAYNLAARIKWSTSKAKRGKKGWYLIIPFRHYTPGRASEGATPGRFSNAMPHSIYAIARQLQAKERLTFKGAEKVAKHRSAVQSRGRTVAIRGIGPGRPDGHPLGAHPGGKVMAVTSASALRAAHSNARRVHIGGGRSVMQHPGHAKSPGSLRGGADLARMGKIALPSPFRAERTIYEGMVKTGRGGHTKYMTFRVITPQSQWVIPSRPGLHVAQNVARDTAVQVRNMLETAFKADVERTITGSWG